MSWSRWVALATVFVATRTVAADPPCKPSAQVTGDGTITRAIEVVLRARGIDVNAPAVGDAAFVTSACRQVSADVSVGDGGRLVVVVTDTDGRRTQRMAEDTEAAATVIESWARADLIDPLLASRGTIEGARFGTAAGSQLRETRPRFLVAAGGDVGLSGDGAVWLGGRVHGCAAIGAYCVGGTLRYAVDTERNGDSKQLETGRTGIGLSLTGERVVRWGRFSISPGLGVGLKSVSATFGTEDELEQASSVHARAGVATAYQVAGAWALRVDLDGELAPFARERLGEDDGVDHQLAASPKLQTWFGIAITYGGP